METVGKPPAPPMVLRAEVSRDWPFYLFLSAIPIGVASRLVAGWNLPFWLDETFTGVIASQHTFRQVLQWCLSEVTGPFFYMPMWVWAKLAGTSDAALRAPPLIFSIVAPFLIAWCGHPDRTLRLFWATLMLLWLPILPMATEARAYPQLLLLATGQSILFLRLAGTPNRTIAIAWSTLASLAALTHVYAVMITAFQGLALLMTHRHRLLRLWPALVPFVFAAIWMVLHVRFLLTYATGHAAYYDPFPMVMVLGIPIWVFGNGPQGYLLLALIAYTWKLWWRDRKSRSPEAQLVWTGLAAFALLFTMGLIQATMMPRYLTSVMPALLLGVACWANHLRRGEPTPVIMGFGILAAAMAATLVFGASDKRFRERRYFQFETASAWMMDASPQRLHFLWSTATGAQSGSDYLEQVAGFFFKRARHPVDVVVSRGGTDPNQALVEAARADPNAAILWISDDPLRMGIVPDIPRVDRRWQCRNFGGEGILVYACRVAS